MKITTLLIAILLFSVSSLIAQTKPAELMSVPSLDLNRYSGKWYEIAKYPNRFQKQCVGNTTANYTLKPNGRIEVANECLKKDGTNERAVGEAKIPNKSNNAKLKVRFAPKALSFLPFVWANYWVIELADDYSYAVIGEPGRDYFWILARKPTIDDATYQNILRRAEAKGFQPARIEKTPQNVEALKGSVIVKN